MKLCYSVLVNKTTWYVLKIINSLFSHLVRDLGLTSFNILYITFTLAFVLSILSDSQPNVRKAID